MIRFFEKLIAAIWNRLASRRREARSEGAGVDIGYRVVDGQATRNRVALTSVRRSMHMAALGKTGSGKSSLLRYLAEQDILADRGFLYFDVHGADTPLLLRAINARERRERRHLSGKTILIEPADEIVSVGMNPLEGQGSDFVRIAELAQILKNRWHLDLFGARTDELLRNSLFALSANGLTLVELALFLTHAGFRKACLKQVENSEVCQYFELRYDQASEPMRATMREPILNKTSAFTADPHFRHIVGQSSTFSLKQAMDEGFRVIVNLDKGRLGEQAFTLGSLMLSALKNTLFTRRKRSLFTVYCDEIQNLVAYGSGIETILSEGRKFQVPIISANQYLDQHSAEMRAALLSVGTSGLWRRVERCKSSLSSPRSCSAALAFSNSANRARRQLATSFERNSSAMTPVASATDIFGALWRVKATIESDTTRGAPSAPKAIWIFSDMINETKQFSMPELIVMGPESMLERAKANGLLVPLNGYRVHVLGASPSGLSPQSWTILKRFWTIYFSAAGADLLSYSVEFDVKR